jgi:thioredoxin 1
MKTDIPGAVELTRLNFETEVLKSDKPVLVIFWANFCFPCRLLNHEFYVGLSKELADISVKVCTLDTEDGSNAGMGDEHGVTCIPTTVLFVRGVPIKKIIGFNSKEEILSHFQPELNLQPVEKKGAEP